MAGTNAPASTGCSREVVDFYEDAGISGSNGRDKRPGLDRLLNDATELERRILRLYRGGMGMVKIGRTLGVGTSVVQRVVGAEASG
jgi:hypothetical protein